jgi:hypothetical protein
MANKRINQLDTRVPSGTDLVLIGDPVSGYSYKTTVSDIIAVAANNATQVYFIPGDVGYPAVGASTYTNANFSGADIMLVFRNGLPQFNRDPGDGDTYFTFAGTTVTFSAALGAGEKIIIVSVKLT